MAKSKKKVKKKVTEKKDKFGSRIGGRNAKINAVLSKKPKKMKELSKAANVPGTYYEHLNKLIEQGIVVKSENGYALK